MSIFRKSLEKPSLLILVIRFLKQILSKALEKSAKIIIVTSERFMAFTMSSRIAWSTVVVAGLSLSIGRNVTVENIVLVDKIRQLTENQSFINV